MNLPNIRYFYLFDHSHIGYMIQGESVTFSTALGSDEWADVRIRDSFHVVYTKKKEVERQHIPGKVLARHARLQESGRKIK